MNKVGVLWKKKYTKDGIEKTLLSGIIDLGILGEVSITVFANDKKTEEKHPDYNIVRNKKDSFSPREAPSTDDLAPF